MEQEVIEIEPNNRKKRTLKMEKEEKTIYDLPKASLVLQKAYEYVVLRETQNTSVDYVDEDIIEEVI